MTMTERSCENISQGRLLVPWFSIFEPLHRCSHCQLCSSSSSGSESGYCGLISDAETDRRWMRMPWETRLVMASGSDPMSLCAFQRTFSWVLAAKVRYSSSKHLTKVCKQKAVLLKHEIQRKEDYAGSRVLAAFPNPDNRSSTAFR